jgi:proteasome lid subunit RPN8/RPN11
MSLRLRARANEIVHSHLCRSYPEEGCGVLLGTDSGGTRLIEQAEPVANQRTDSRGNRYLISPEELMLVERGAREKDWDVLGFFHSHPDHPPVPSAFDLENAWPFYSYLIVSVVGGAVAESRSWRLADDRGAFQPETLELLTDP